MLERLEVAVGSTTAFAVGRGDDDDGVEGSVEEDVTNNVGSMFTTDAAATRCFSNVFARVRGPKSGEGPVLSTMPLPPVLRLLLALFFREDGAEVGIMAVAADDVV